MNITYIHQHFRLPNENGGGRPYEFASRLAEQGHFVTVLCGGADSWEREILPGCRVVRLPCPYSNQMPFATRVLAFLSFVVRATIAASRIPADRVFASSTPLTVILPGAIGAFFQRAPFILEIRDLWPALPIELGVLPKALHGPSRQLERFGYHVASAVIALSPGMADGVRAVNDNVRVETIPNCSDPALFRTNVSRQQARERFGVTDDRPTLYYAGGLGRAHDPLWLAELAVALRGRVHVLIAGEGSMREKAAEICRSSDLDPEQVFLGAISRDEVALLATAADAALSSIMDSPGLLDCSLNKVFDALAAAKPVVFNHGGWLSDRLTSEGAGIQMPRDLTSHSADELVRWLSDPQSRDLAAARAGDLSQEFDRDKIFEKFQDVLLAPRG